MVIIGWAPDSSFLMITHHWVATVRMIAQTAMIVIRFTLPNLIAWTTGRFLVDKASLLFVVSASSTVFHFAARRSATDADMVPLAVIVYAVGAAASLSILALSWLGKGSLGCPPGSTFAHWLALL